MTRISTSYLTINWISFAALEHCSHAQFHIPVPARADAHRTGPDPGWWAAALVGPGTKRARSVSVVPETAPQRERMWLQGKNVFCLAYRKKLAGVAQISAKLRDWNWWILSSFPFPSLQVWLNSAGLELSIYTRNFLHQSQAHQVDKQVLQASRAVVRACLGNARIRRGGSHHQETFIVNNSNMSNLAVTRDIKLESIVNTPEWRTLIACCLKMIHRQFVKWKIHNAYYYQHWLIQIRLNRTEMNSDEY